MGLVHAIAALFVFWRLQVESWKADPTYSGPNIFIWQQLAGIRRVFKKHKQFYPRSRTRLYFGALFTVSMVCFFVALVSGTRS